MTNFRDFFWDLDIQTASLSTWNQILLLRKKNSFLVDVTFSANHNIKVQGSDKLKKYTYIQIEFDRIWDIETIIISVIICPWGFIVPKVKSYVKFRINPSIPSFQKSVFLRAAFIMRMLLFAWRHTIWWKIHIMHVTKLETKGPAKGEK